LRIEDFRVVIGGMTNDDPPQQPEVTFARMAQKGIRALVKRQVGKGTYEGTATAKILYGPPDSESVRRYTYRVKLNLNVDEATGTAFYSDEIIEEKDQPYVG
jgi:hypothetical protein